MIKSLERIENLGIFEKYTKSSTLNDFMKYNLLYGWNGSGKSTLSKLFRILEIKQVHENFSEVEFKIKLDNGEFITEI